MKPCRRNEFSNAMMVQYSSNRLSGLAQASVLVAVGVMMLAPGCRRDQQDEPQTQASRASDERAAIEPPPEPPTGGVDAPATSTLSEHTAPSPPNAEVAVPNPSDAEMQPQVRELLEPRRAAVLAAPSSLEAWLSLGIACDSHKLYECAEQCYRRGLELAPGDFQSTYFLAFVLTAMGRDDDEAIELYRAAIKLRPNFIPSYCWLGRTLQQRGKNEEALDVYMDALSVNPDAAYAHRGAGQVLSSLGEEDMALQHLERAAGLKPNDQGIMSALSSAYRRMGKPVRFASPVAGSGKPVEPLIPDPVRAVVRETAVDSGTLLVRAKELIHAGKHAEAIPTLKIIERATPDNPFVHVFLGTCYRRTGKRGLAAAHLKKAVRLRESSSSAQFEYAVLLIELGRIGEGLEHYERAVTYSENPRDIHIWVGAALNRAGFAEPAVTAFEQAAEIRLLSAKEETLWGSALYKLGDFAGAAEHFGMSTLLDPRNADVYYDRGLSFEGTEQFDEAKTQYRKALVLDPDHAAARSLARLEAAGP